MWARLLNLSVCLLNQNKSLVSFCFLIRASDGSQITRPLVPCRVPRDAVVAGGRTEEKQDTRGAGALQALPWLSIKLQARYRRATAADLAKYKITGALRARYRRATAADLASTKLQARYGRVTAVNPPVTRYRLD